MPSPVAEITWMQPEKVEEAAMGGNRFDSPKKQLAFSPQFTHLKTRPIQLANCSLKCSDIFGTILY